MIICSGWHDVEADQVVYATWSLPSQHPDIPKHLLINYERGAHQWYTSRTKNYTVVLIAIHRDDWLRFRHIHYRRKPNMQIEFLKVAPILKGDVVPTTDMCVPLRTETHLASLKDMRRIRELYHDPVAATFDTAILCVPEVQAEMGGLAAKDMSLVYIKVPPQREEAFRHSTQRLKVSVHSTALTPARATALTYEKVPTFAAIT